MSNYIECPRTAIPSAVRFDTPRPNQGQIVEVSYGGFGRTEAGPGAPFMRREDRSVPTGKPGRVTYYRLSNV